MIQEEASKLRIENGAARARQRKRGVVAAGIRRRSRRAARAAAHDSARAFCGAFLAGRSLGRHDTPPAGVALPLRSRGRSRSGMSLSLLCALVSLFIFSFSILSPLVLYLSLLCMSLPFSVLFLPLPTSRPSSVPSSSLLLPLSSSSFISRFYGSLRRKRI